jgi:uncharacterized oxidoreductase
MPVVEARGLERLTRDIFVACGVPEDDAAWVATLLVRANLRGHDSHGVIRVPSYVRGLRSGAVNPTPAIRVEGESETVARVDGDRGLGQVVARHGMLLAMDRARRWGLGAVTLRRTAHVGRLADYTEMAAAAELIGMMWVNAPTALSVAPWGGAARRLGTNPHAVAVPGPKGRVAMSLDFATSVFAEGKLRVKLNRGEAVPPGVILDGMGRPTTDPTAFYADPPGMLLPMAGHKGYGLALVVEVLAGILSGTGAARAEPGPVQNGALMVCLDPRRFLPLEEFHRHVEALFEFVRSAPLAEGAEAILIPGEPEARSERERGARGIPVEEATWRQLVACAAEVGVAANPGGAGHA